MNKMVMVAPYSGRYIAVKTGNAIVLEMLLQQYLRQLVPAASRFLNYVNTVYGPVFIEQIEVNLKKCGSY